MARQMTARRRRSMDFSDRLTGPLPRPRDFVRVLRSGAMKPRDLSQVGRIPVRTDGFREAPAGGVAVTWVGHASFVVQIGGLVVLTDPVFSRRIPGVRPRLTRPGLPMGALPRIDAVVLSHNHYDHLDAPTIRRLPRDTAIFVPACMARWFLRRDFTRVTELDWWESASLGDVDFDFVPAHHWSRRTLLDTCASLWGGWVLTHAGTRVYFAGDTGYGKWFGEIGERYPGIDVALLPTGAYEPRWLLSSVHMDPADAVKACADVGARRMVPMHWGTFALSAEPVLEPLELTRAQWLAAGRDRTELWDLAIGETRVLAARDGQPCDRRTRERAA